MKAAWLAAWLAAWAPRSLQARLTLGVLALVGAVWLATAALVALDAGHELDELLDGHLAQAAALLVAQQARELDEHGERERGDDSPAVDAPVLHRYAPRVAFQVFHEGRLVLRSAGAQAEPLLPLRHDGAAAPHEGFQTVE